MLVLIHVHCISNSIIHYQMLASLLKNAKFVHMFMKSITCGNRSVTRLRVCHNHLTGFKQTKYYVEIFWFLLLLLHFASSCSNFWLINLLLGAQEETSTKCILGHAEVFSEFNFWCYAQEIFNFLSVLNKFLHL